MFTKTMIARPLSSAPLRLRKVDGWKTLATKLIGQPIDLAARG
jgi:hypothetical protein